VENIAIEILFILFFTEIVIDFILGIVVAAKERRLKSSRCRDGLFKSLGEITVLIMFMLVSKFVPGIDALLYFFIPSFIFKELLSILANLSLLDVYIPLKLVNALEEEINKKENNK
jgi:toxin secretion/phage lysis holin